MLPDTSLEQFHSHLVATNNGNTASKYRLAAQKFLAFVGSNRLQLEDLPPGVLSHFSEVLTYQGLKPSSVSVMTAGAKKFLKWLQDRGVIATTFFSSPDLPRIVRQIPNAMKDEDLLAFFGYAAMCPEPVRTAILLLPYCGLRSNEMTTLQLGALKRVDVPMTEGLVPHVCFQVLGKGSKYRTVPLLLDGKPLLMQYLEGWRKTQVGPYLFPMSDGSPVANRTIRHYVQWIRTELERNGKNPDRLTPHTLRRTYATTLWRAGVPAETLAKILGHEDVKTTMTHYLEVRAEDLAGAVGRSGAQLIARGPYADKVRGVQDGVDTYLKSLKESD